MKKLITFLLLTTMVLSLTACGGSGSDSGSKSDSGDSSQTDMEYVKDKGTLVVGVTEYEPMDYKDENDEWIGFDADMAKAFAKSLDVEVEFIEIDWDNKIMELDGKTIDCVWNGMTLTPEVTSAMDCSDPYCGNAQVVIVPSEEADKYPDADSLSDLTFAVEAGSAGESEAENNQLDYTPVKTQADALMEVAAGTSGAAVIDSSMADAMVGEGTSYENLAVACVLNSEEYGVGFRKGSDLVNAVNDFFAESLENGTTMKYAEAYNMQDLILEK